MGDHKPEYKIKQDDVNNLRSVKVFHEDEDEDEYAWHFISPVFA